MHLDTIYNEDMLLGMSRIPAESIDCIVTDPPYKTTRRGRPGDGVKKNVGGMLSGNGQFFERQYDIEMSDWFPLLYDCLKPGKHAYVFTNLLNLYDMFTAAKACGFQIQNLLVWQKNNATPSQYYMKNCEYVLLLRKGAAKWINNQGSKTVHRFDNVRKKAHPCEKPVELLRFYIENSTEEGDVVLDPFIGGGSTALAAISSNRHFVGFELDKNFYTVAMQRILMTAQKGGKPCEE